MSPWRRPGELTESALDDLEQGLSPARCIHDEMVAFRDAHLDPNEDSPEETEEELLRQMIGEFERARHYFAQLVTVATYALAQAERPVDA